MLQTRGHLGKVQDRSRYIFRHNQKWKIHHRQRQTGEGYVDKPRALGNMKYPPKKHLKLKSCLPSDIAMLCAKFQNDRTTEMNFIDKQYFERFFSIHRVSGGNPILHSTPDYKLYMFYLWSINILKPKKWPTFGDDSFQFSFFKILSQEGAVLLKFASDDSVSIRSGTGSAWQVTNQYLITHFTGAHKHVTCAYHQASISILSFCFVLVILWYVYESSSGLLHCL